jgi:hypothetical protein
MEKRKGKKSLILCVKNVSQYQISQRIKNIWGLFANKKCMGTDCQCKMHGDTLPIKSAWGHFANTKCMGTDCQDKIYGDTLPIKNARGHFAWGQIANKHYMGTLFQYCLQIYIYIHKIKTMHGMRIGAHSTLYI